MFVFFLLVNKALTPAKIVSEYDQEIPQSQTADKPVDISKSQTIFSGSGCDIYQI